jgi:hypothetical protein
VTYFPNSDEGDSRFEFFRNVVAWHPVSSTLNQLEWSFDSSPSHFALALFTFLYVDIIDATATLYSMARFCGTVDPQTGDFPRSTLAYCTDAAFISIGALLGSSPVTAFIESGAGIFEGGRTGLTAVVTGLCFIISIFFAPIFASIPPWATGCALVLVSQRRPCFAYAPANLYSGWLYHGSSNHWDQLELYWRPSSFFRRHHIHSLQLQRRLRPYGVSFHAPAYFHGLI